jgi:hypothetical protein
MLYGHRNGLRLGRIGPAVTEINNQMQAVENDQTVNSTERHILKDGDKRMRKALCKKHRCSQLRLLLASDRAPSRRSSSPPSRRSGTSRRTRRSSRRRRSCG